MEQILVLVDFDNYATLNDVPGQRPRQHHIDRCIEQLIDSLIEWSKQHKLHTAEMKIRLYSGWYSDRDVDSRTELRCMVDTFCYAMTKRRGKYRALISAADSPLYFTDVTFTYTLQEVKNSIKIKQTHLGLCRTKETCKTKVVDEWQSNGCPGCTITHDELLKKFSQKNVDTAIVADTIYASLQKIYKYIILVSADYDMLPGILFASTQNQQVAIFRKFESVWFDFMLGDCEIQSDITPNYR